MFPFSPPKNQDEIRRLFNDELRFFNAVATNALDMAFRFAELNLCALKQTAASWTSKSSAFSLPEGNAAPEWLDSAHLGKDFENMTAYGQQIAKLMLDMQSAAVDLAQQRAAHATNMATATIRGGSTVDAPAANAPSLEFIQDMLAQASKGYAQWAGSVASAMDTDMTHATSEKGNGSAVKTRARK